ncbi:MAG: hypothetical protein KO202_05570 [Methanobacteriaceae archaeon]|jgi:hypothetical protein|nr:hypothetical protein [Methanobacteriaceae archaeon]
MDFNTLMIIRMLILILIVYAILKNIKLLLVIGLIILAFLFLESYYGFNLEELVNQIFYLKNN